MKAAVLTGIKKVEIQNVPDPVISGPKDVLIRVNAVGMCGSDVHYYKTGRIGSQIVEYPFIVGHEFGGTVLAVGDQVTRVKPGDLIAVDPAMPCFECDQCMEGRFHTCRKLLFLGCPGQASGCLSEKIVMPETSCFPVPEGADAEDAALVEPLSIGCHAVRLSNATENSRILIQGCGPIGLSVMLALHKRGCKRIVVSEPLPYRREIALKMGADFAFAPDDLLDKAIEKEPLGYDVAFECCGEQDALDQAQVILKPGGKLMLIGIPTTHLISLSSDQIRRREICVQNVRRQNECMDEALELVSQMPEARQMITHHYSLEETAEVFETVSGYNDGVVKAMINC